MICFDGPTVTSERDVSVRSVSFFVNELTGADDDLMNE